MKLAWGKVVTPEFRQRVLRMAMQDGYDPSYAMAIMYFESKINPTAVNGQSGATGLIQFMPRTAIDLGTTVDALRNMSAVEQLDYVARYFHRYTGRLKTLSDMYMAVLWPAAIGKPEDHILFAAGTKAYDQNKALDTNSDGAITKAEAVSFVQRALDKGMLEATEELTQKEDIDVLNSTPLPSSPTQPTITQGKPMLPALIPIIFQALASSLPVISQIFGARGEVSDRNMKLAQVALDTVVKTTGAINEQDAVEKVQNDPAMAAQVNAALTMQPDVAAYLDHVKPMLAQLAQHEQALWSANDSSADRAAARAVGMKNDIAPALVNQANYLFVGVLLAVSVLVGVQVWLNKGVVDSGTYALLSVLVYGVVRMADRPSAFRFGGSYESAAVNSGSTVINQTVEDRRKPQ